MNNIIATGNIIFVYFDYDEYIEKDSKILQDTNCTKMSIIYNNPKIENLYDFLNVIGKKQGKRNRKILEYNECNDYIKETHFAYNENIQYLSIQLEQDMSFDDYNIVKQPKRARLC